MRYRGFGKAPKQSNMKNKNNLSRSKSFCLRLASSKSALREAYAS